MGNQHALKQDDALQKRTAMALSDLSSGGLLAPEVAERFIQVALDATPVLAAARRQTMNSHTMRIPLMAFGSRIMTASPGDNTALDPSVVQKPDLSEISLVSVEITGMVPLPDQVVEDNIERDRFQTSLLTMIAKRVGVDVEELGLNGDTTSGDAYLALTDGWLKRASSHVVDASGADISDALFSTAYEAVPLKYRQQAMEPYRWYTHDHIANRWRDQLAARGTPLGDRYAISDEIPPAKGKVVLAAANIKAAGSPLKTTALFTTPANLVVGFHRDIKIEPWRNAPLRRMEFHISARVAYAIEQNAAVAKITNLKAS